MIPLSYNTRSLAVRKSTTIATSLGVALVVFVMATALMLSAGIHKTFVAAGRDDTAITVRKGSRAEFSSLIDEETARLIMTSPGVATDARGQPMAMAENVVVGLAEKVGVAGFSNLQIRGVADNVFEFRPEVRIVAGRRPQPGSDEAMIGQSIRGHFKGIDLDQSYELRKGRVVKIVGVFSSGGSMYDSELWVGRDLLRDAYHRGSLSSSVRVRLTSRQAFDGFRGAMESDKRLGLSAMRESDYFEQQSEGMSTIIGGLGTAIAVFCALGAMIGATITMYAAVANRQREIGTLRALGFSRTSILLSFLFESVMLALIGGIVGVLAATTMKFVHVSILNQESWSELVFSFDPTPEILIRAFLFAAIMGLFGGFLPAVRAARVSPIAAIRAL